MNLTSTNNTFSGGEPTWASACVGDNRAPGAIAYAKGFASAGNALLDSAIANRGMHLTVDTLVYPVCFTTRHAVELFLKKVIEDLVGSIAPQGRSRTSYDSIQRTGATRDSTRRQTEQPLRGNLRERGRAALTDGCRCTAGAGVWQSNGSNGWRQSLTRMHHPDNVT
jgi:hypothetical protein